MASEAAKPAAAAEKAVWRVAGEGNANIVLTYCGDDPVLAGLALRFAKDVPQHADEAHEIDEAVEEAVWGDVLPSETQLHEVFGIKSDAQVCAMRASQFIKNVLEPYLGRFARTGVPIKLPAEASAVLSARCGVDAPAGTPVMLMRNQASLAAVARGLPAGLSLKGAVLCLEVKLKWGFLPFSPLLDDGPRGKLKRTVPRFLLHQLLKREKRRAKAAAAGAADAAADGDPSDPNDVRGLSLYNPVDLMSGDVERMRMALENLMDMPSNNLRLFLDGRLVIGGRPDADSKSDAYGGGTNKRTIKDVLVHELDAQPGHEGEVCAKFAVFASVMLLHSGVLRSVRQVQMLDRVDVEGALLLYARLVAELEQRGGRRPSDVPLSRLRLKRKKQAVQQEPQTSAPPAEKKANLDGSKDAEMDERMLSALRAAEDKNSCMAELLEWDRAKVTATLRDFLTSATIKDCGVMVAMQRLAVDPQQAEQLTAQATDSYEAAGKVLSVVVLPPPDDAPKESDDTPSGASDLPTIDATAAHVEKSLRRVILIRDVEAKVASQAILFQVSLVDMDPKPASKIPTNWELDQECVRVGLESLPLLRTLGYDLTASESDGHCEAC